MAVASQTASAIQIDARATSVMALESMRRPTTTLHVQYMPTGKTVDQRRR
jgi:hypothetical protein